MPSEQIAFTADTRALATRLLRLLPTLGCPVATSVNANRFPPPGPGTGPRAAMPSGRVRPEDGDLRALEVPVTMRGDWTRVSTVIAALRQQSFRVRCATLVQHEGVRLFVSTPELQARSRELRGLERAARRAPRVGHSVLEALTVLGEAETVAERDDLARRAIEAHALTPAMVARLLRHPERAVRVAALAALATLRPLLAGWPPRPWTQILEQARQSAPPALLEDVDALVANTDAEVEVAHEASGLDLTSAYATEALDAFARRTPEKGAGSRTPRPAIEARLLDAVLERLQRHLVEGNAGGPLPEGALARTARAILDPDQRHPALQPQALQAWKPMLAMVQHLTQVQYTTDVGRTETAPLLEAVLGRMRRTPHPDFYEALGAELHGGLAELELGILALVCQHLGSQEVERSFARTVLDGAGELRELAAQLDAAPEAATHGPPHAAPGPGARTRRPNAAPGALAPTPGS